MSFREYISEVLDSSVEYEWTTQSSVRWEGIFSINNKTFILNMENRSVHIELDITDEDHQMQGWLLEFADATRGYNFNLTGSGDALQVFGTAGAMLKDWVMKNSNVPFYFSAKGRSRRKLYSTFSKRLRKILSKDFQEFETIDNSTYFQFS